MRYESPTTVEAAVTLLANEAGKAHILAGGTDLLVRLRSGFIEPDLIVDLKRIDALKSITMESDGLRVGAAVPSAMLNEHADAVAGWPGVCEAASLIGSTQVQGRATISGNLCNASPAADSVPAMVAARAIARISGPQGMRDVPVEEIATGPGKTSLAKGEFVDSILLPKRAPGTSDAYLRFIPRTEMDIAVVGVGICVTVDKTGTCTAARVALGAVAAKILVVEAAAQALIGTKGDEAALNALAAACSAAATPIDDKRGTVAFRKEIAGTLAKRAAKIALSRAEKNL
ncbi:MAG TPA: oxidoreductase [Rhodospirillaceae bacterium]|nr:oxidoreductase [Rhodospirillaceae bacterium]MAX62494.1 oxidoreductase [Rhodospirillaceae bacterium]MAX65097.1 oxidoreductase [Rhodospirillaceae bacterium]HAE01659.1 oxidoreductase [Rhodospirillaceae bacterium]|tara:strand:- start:76082 stop:76945 length:864 start_codon:yes stop_codon:yes gene_type:complete